MLMSNRGGPARIHYMANNYRLLTPGDHVLCALTGEKIMLEDLRYWSVTKQEAYVSAEIGTQAALKR